MMRTPRKSPLRRELLMSTSSVGSTSFSQSQSQHQQPSSNNVRVVVRIRPMNAQERAQGSRSVLYPAAAPEAEPFQQQQQPDSPCSSVSSHNSLASRGRKVLSKLRGGRGKKQSKEEATTDPTEESDPPTESNNNNNKAKIYPTICHAEMGSNNNNNNYANSTNTTNNSNKRLAFEFDAVYGPDTTQMDLYQSAIGDMITDNMAAHYNTTIFAYGQTGSGKSTCFIENC